MINAQMQGMDNLNRALAAVAKLPKGNQLAMLLKNEISEATSRLTAAAQTRTPYEEGTLRASGTDTVELSAAKAMATVTFGGQAADYASVQHEREDFQHSEGQAHFLHGAGDSAWEQNEAAYVRMLDEHAGKVTDAWLQGQIGQ